MVCTSKPEATRRFFMEFSGIANFVSGKRRRRRKKEEEDQEEEEEDEEEEKEGKG